MMRPPPSLANSQIRERVNHEHKDNEEDKSIDILTGGQKTLHITPAMTNNGIPVEIWHEIFGDILFVSTSGSRSTNFPSPGEIENTTTTYRRNIKSAGTGKGLFVL
jgi:hypothetical protein